MQYPEIDENTLKGSQSKLRSETHGGQPSPPRAIVGNCQPIVFWDQPLREKTPRQALPPASAFRDGNPPIYRQGGPPNKYIK